MASTVHQTRNQERNSPFHRAGSLPARLLASVLRRLEWIIPPFIENFLLCQIPSCFPAGPWTYTGLSCPAWAPVLYLSFPSVLEVFSFPSKGIPDKPQMLCPMSESPSGKREGFQDNATRKKREVYYWLEPGLLPQPTQWYRIREPRAQAITQIYRMSISSW